MKITKMHGLGNDFVVTHESELPASEQWADLAVALCDRHFGIGADGLIVVGPAEGYDMYMRIFNSDGSEPEMCGNGIRCVAKYAWERGLVKNNPIRVKTLAGLILPEVIVENGVVTSVRVDMGQPILEAAAIPVQVQSSPVVASKITVDGSEFEFTAVSMGNPHCVIFVDSLKDEPARTHGPKIEVHPLFPKKTNVEFVEVLGQEEMIMNVWERGAGETLACGTGTCATLVAAVLNGKTGRKATVHLKGGDLVIEWSEADNKVFMTGPATEVFETVIQADALVRAK
ncbi:MAG: diaminopimelate epimerase [Solirubrobacterales bacterium]